MIHGGRSPDVVTGGGGTFVFYRLSDSRGKKIDTTTDMSGADVIAFSTLDANRNSSGNQFFDFIGTATFSAADQIRIDNGGDNIIVQANVNAGRRTYFEVILEDIGTMNVSDFIL